MRPSLRSALGSLSLGLLAAGGVRAQVEPIPGSDHPMAACATTTNPSWSGRRVQSCLPRATSRLSPADTACPAAGCPPQASPVGTVFLPGSLAELPVDRIADLLALEPGVASLNRGDLSVRGTGTNALMVYLDGVPGTPGRRDFHTALLGGSWYGEAGSGLGLGTNGFDALTLYPGFAPAARGGGLGGVIDVRSASSERALPAGSARRIGLRGAWATDALFGTSGGLDFNRVVFNGGGRTGRLDVSVAGVVEGQGSVRLGQDQNASPIYLSAGVDTTVAVTGTGTQTVVNVYKFVPSPGIRIPASAVSSYTVLGHAAYRIGAGQELGLTVLGSQTQQRQFDYLNLYDPLQLQANRSWSRVIIGSWRGNLVQRDGLALAGEAHLSWQTDREIDGPLTTVSEQSSRYPFGGFLIGALGFRFDFDNFAVNDQLVRNFRTNSGRLSPYDLTQATQYSLFDQWRNNAYAAVGFTDGGGPIGPLTLARENRTVATAAVTGRIGSRHRVRVGAEYTGYREAYYSSWLLSQALSDAYVESPSRSALFADYTLDLDRLRVDAGVRLDRFSSGASRPDFPRISTAPGFDPANPTAQFIADHSHSRVSPRIRVTGEVTDRVTAFGAVTALAQAPDFSAIYTGINTDLSVTSLQQVYGTDLDFERATLGELGARVAVAPATTVEGTVWTRGSQRRPTVVLENAFDPLRLQNIDLSRFRLMDPGSASGLDLRLRHALGREGQAWLSYSYVDPAEHEQASSRPHTLAAAILYNTGSDLQGPAAALRDVGVYGAFRIASGTAYTPCPTSNPSDAGVITPGFCTGAPAGGLFSARLPTLKVLDLRVSKSIPLGGLSLTAFVDARNLLNTRNVIHLFAQTGTVTNPLDRLIAREAYLQSLAAEANRNGVLLPDSSVDLSFAGAQDPRTGCGGWQRDNGASASPNCVYLIAAEERFGNGDHVFTPAEQLRASDALYQANRGLQYFTAPGRRARVGVALRF